ncbi:class F sortase [Curtobacterium sp. HSID17257]|nr:class F sortase [Curtobacterium sp. HSID17257]
MGGHAPAAALRRGLLRRRSCPRGLRRADARAEHSVGGAARPRRYGRDGGHERPGLRCPRSGGARRGVVVGCCRGPASDGPDRGDHADVLRRRLGGARCDHAHLGRPRRLCDRGGRRIVTGRRAATGGTRWWSGRRGVVVGGVLAAVLVGGGIAGVAVATTGTDGTGPQAAASSAASATADPGAAANGSGAGDTSGFQDPAAPAARSTATPVRVEIPAIGVSSGLEDLGRGSAGELDPPKDWDSAGWFADGIVPGQVGPAVIAGHVDSPTSAAVFFRLDELVAGDEIHVSMSDGSDRTFTVERSERAAKSAFPTSDVYGSSPTPQLRLITCDGTFDTATGHYTDNLIVFADLSSG